MTKERMMILEMLESGKITPADAEVLFRALGEEADSEGATDVAAPYPPEPDSQREMNPPSGFWQPGAEPDQPAPTPPGVIGKITQMLSKTPAPHNRRRRYPDPSYAVAMKRTGLDFSIDQLFRLQEEDIDPEQAARFVSASRPEWTTDEIVEMLTQGASPDLLNTLNELGFARLSARDVIQLTEHGVEPEYLERFRGIPISGLTARDLIEFADNDVEPDLVIALRETGPVTAGEVVKAAENDLSPAFVRQIARVLPSSAAAGNRVRQWIELNENDVTPEFIETLVRGGFTNLTVKQLIHLQENDIDPHDAAWFRARLGERITLDDLVRLADQDVSRDYVESLLAFNLPDLTVETLINMADRDISAEDVALAREAYGDQITAADLIEIADNQ